MALESDLRCQAARFSSEISGGKPLTMKQKDRKCRSGVVMLVNFDWKVYCFCPLKKLICFLLQGIINCRMESVALKEYKYCK